ncbi:ATP-binding cassette domain-containing protein [Telmatocola sphagniphila]|uniref:ATP-binding cassette domain-containing protein n=1 Tax=Telmatocola sphagniphila TaxID=1123043 RepID=A0A8E6EWT6_9BACT|nr:ATP-binding cassette domain-containing protein [Telmatocola sphagniphila]QVL30923.1 ATP-binding cassette domain-containing protein [Telmatocola sphagniphila]
MAKLIEIENGRFVRMGNEVAIQDLSWVWQDGETWAITGDVGSGKTTFLDLLLGQLRQTEGQIHWPILEVLRRAGRPVAWPSEIMERVSFKEESRLFSYGKHYYQQRYDFADADDIPTLEEYLRNGSPFEEAHFEPVCDELHIKNLLPLTLVKLSNGQTRRARLARALLRKPEILLLDEPFIGLDVQTRAELDQLLKSLVARGQRLVVTTKPDQIPDWVTNVRRLGPISTTVSKIATHETSAEIAGEPIIECENVRVTYGGKPILQNISWVVRRGEHWVLSGPNGSGKTTLLSLLCGDHPQAYGNNIRLFGSQRGSGETIWEIKKRIGFVSPELHLYFNEPLDGYDAAGSGFHDVLVHRELTPEQQKRLDKLFAHFELNELKKRPFRQMSTGEQRMILLVRALVKEPELMILDEPFQGLDTRRVELLKDWLENHVRADQTIIFVSHVLSDIPGNMRHHLRLENGRIAVTA